MVVSRSGRITPIPVMRKTLEAADNFETVLESEHQAVKQTKVYCVTNRVFPPGSTRTAVGELCLIRVTLTK
jgi:hypothetical protein